MPAVVAPEDDDRVAGVLARVQGVQQPADVRVDEADRGQVALDRPVPLVVPQHHRVVLAVPAEVAGVRDRVHLRREFLPERRKVVPVAVQGRRQFDALERVEVEVLPGHVPGQVRLGEAASQEEGLLARLVQLADRPVHDLDIEHLGVVHVEGSPGRPGGLRDTFLPLADVPGASRPRRRVVLVPGVRIAGARSMEDLAAALRGVAVRLQVLHQGHGVGQLLAKPLAVAVDAGLRRQDARQQTDPGGVAERRRRVGPGERHAAARQAIDVRRARLRVAGQVADPVVQVVDGDEENVRRPVLRRRGCSDEHGQSDERCSVWEPEHAASRPLLTRSTIGLDRAARVVV